MPACPIQRYVSSCICSNSVSSEPMLTFKNPGIVTEALAQCHAYEALIPDMLLDDIDVHRLEPPSDLMSKVLAWHASGHKDAIVAFSQRVLRMASPFVSGQTIDCSRQIALDTATDGTAAHCAGAV
jgi:hypothetical protein